MIISEDNNWCAIFRRALGVHLLQKLTRLW
jgi:hypothetical protein